MCMADVLLPMNPLADTQIREPLLPHASTSSLADSDEFRMYNAKILPCRKRYHHDWNECIFSHVGEKVQRRCPRKCNYMGIMCPDMKKFNQCPKGEECCFAHNSFEYWLHPTRYRTEMCTFGPACKRCVCFFAHTPEQLRGYGKTTLAAASATNGLPNMAPTKAGVAGPQGYNPSLRTPVVVGNRVNLEYAAEVPSMVVHQPAPGFQAPSFSAPQAARPALRTPTFSPDPYVDPLDAYSPVAVHPSRQPSPAPDTYHLPLHYAPVSGALPAPSLQLAASTPPAAAHLVSSGDTFDTAARYISMLASRAAPAPSPNPTSQPSLLHPYSPTHAMYPTPAAPRPTAHSPTGSLASSSSGDPALPATPPSTTPTHFATDAAPQAPLYFQPSPQLATVTPQDTPAGRFSPFSPDSPLLAFLPPQQTPSSAELLAEHLANTRLAPRAGHSSRASSRRPSLHTPSIPDSPQAHPTSPRPAVDPVDCAPHILPGPSFRAAAGAGPLGSSPMFPYQHPSAVLAGLAVRTKTVGSPQPAAYASQAMQYSEFQMYMPQLSTGLAAVTAPHHAQATCQSHYATLPATFADGRCPPGANMQQAAFECGYQQPGAGPRLVFGQQAPTLGPHLQ